MSHKLDRLAQEHRAEVKASADHYFDEVNASIAGTVHRKLPDAWTLELDEVAGLYYAPGRIYNRAGDLLWDPARDTIRLFNDLYEAVASQDPTKLSPTITLH